MNPYWTRVAHDTYLYASPSFYDGTNIGKLLKTYAIKVLDKHDNDYVKVFSPDLNCDGYVNKDYIMEGDGKND